MYINFFIIKIFVFIYLQELCIDILHIKSSLLKNIYYKIKIKIFILIRQVLKILFILCTKHKILNII